MRSINKRSSIISFLTILSIISDAVCEGYAKNLRSEWDSVQIRSNVQNDPGASLIGFVIGPILFMMSFALIWFNQKRAAIDSSRLQIVNQLLSSNNEEESQRDLQQQINKNNKDSQNLVYRSGQLNVIQGAYDEVLGVRIAESIKIVREVNVRQYRGYRKSNDQVVIQLVWASSNQVMSEGSANPSDNWKFKSGTTVNSKVQLKSYLLSEELKEQLGCNQMVELTAQMVKNIKQFGNYDRNKQPIIQGQYIYFPGTENDINSHGTLRAKFTYCKLNQATVISSINHDTHQYQTFRIDKYQNKGKQDTITCQGQQICCLCAGAAQIMKPMSQINLIRGHQISQQDLINEQLKKTQMITNILRVTTFIVMVGGIYLFFSPIVDLLGYIPLVGGFLKGTVTTVILAGAVIVSIPLFLITFSLAWLRYRPKIAISLLIVVAIIVAVIVVLDETVKNE